MSSFDFFHFKKLFPELGDQEINSILKICSRKIFPKNTVLCAEGDKNNNVYLIIKGVVRAYYVSSNGIELTPYFWTENLFVASWESLYMSRPSSLNYETIEKTELVIINYQRLRVLIDKSLSLTKTYARILEDTMTLKLFYMQNTIHAKSKERYLKFINDFPKLNARLPQKYVASAIGITPESLSRLKKAIEDEEENVA